MSLGETSANGLKSITSESLALSASLFTSSIDSWVPKDFGVVKSEVDKRREFEQAFNRPIRGIDSSDRLGLGHPLLSLPSSERPNGTSAHTSLSSLARHLHSNKMKEESSLPASQVNGEGEEEDDEEESRSKSLGKGKGKMRASGTLDPFAGKKKKKKQNRLEDPGISLLESSGSSLNGNAATATSTAKHTGELPPEPQPDNLQTRSQTSSPGGSGVFPFAGPVSLSRPSPKNLKKRDRAKSDVAGRVRAMDESGTLDEDGIEEDKDDRSDHLMSGADGDNHRNEKEVTVDQNSVGKEGKKTKTQLRREKRKQRKSEHQSKGS